MSEDFFDGFTWAVPKAFSDAVKACMFEEGDILYDSRKAYGGEWGEAVKHIGHCLQVRLPPRGTTSAANTSGSVFGKNWDTEVTFELQNVAGHEPPQFIETTQGRLFTALWHGDLTVFDNDLNPELPLGLKHVSKWLGQAIQSTDSTSTSSATLIFAMARDVANSISRLKHMKVSAALRSHFKAKVEVWTPKKLGLDTPERIAPTIDIVIYIMECGSYSEIHDVLKAQIYVPAKNTKKDMFRLSTHGVLMPDG